MDVFNPILAQLSLSCQLLEKVKVGCAIFGDPSFLSVYNQIPCDQGGMPKHVMDT